MKPRPAGGPVYIVDGRRTPFLASPRPTTDPGAFTAVDLAVWAGRPLLLGQPFAASDIDEVVLGCVHPAPDEPDPGRLAAFRLGALDAPGWTLQNDAGSGLRAVDEARRGILAGRTDLVLAGGTEAQSRVPVTLSDAAANWLGEWRQASATERARLLTTLRPRHLASDSEALRYPADPVSGSTMAQAADALGYRFGIRRTDADRFALESHRRLAEDGGARHRGEIEPLIDSAGTVYAGDSGAYAGAHAAIGAEDLAALEPVERNGNVTAGNSCHGNDGAAWLLLASEFACEQWSLTPRGRIVDAEWVAMPPAFAGLGPVFAATPLLERHDLARRDVAAWELDEGFAAHVLACLAAWEQADFCRRYLGLRAALGVIEPSRLNVDGGAIALGRPLAAGGTRLVLHLLEVLRRGGGRWGIAALATAGGQGGAVLVEAL